ncbi:hypothetical protein ALI144C_35950 [Actinosynnema sp. ALI-1.44]|uniref:hypothetical protein n=1 Tax=Actinosynnema sp. ALI-1.44 TaxID=1933779 RepID=UPI00097C0CC7|nr:hypothetical protein [Actinosynnema sp. ALI-1.44]ONI76093.1 hypothetical protein ALI144C_35950 [Actinosynnema sp. ALI-1.44]
MTSRQTALGVRVLGATATAGLAFLLAGGTASAAPVTNAPSDSDATMAAQVAAAPETTTRLAKFFVNLDKQSTGMLAQGTPDAQALRAKAPRVTGPARPVYTLTPDFVRSVDAPVATFVYMAVPARSASGQDASILLSRKGTAWSIHQITSGTDAFGPAATGTVFTEPQNNAWYRLDGDRVLPLNQPAAWSVGQDGTSVAKYHDLVHSRYADKLPGSDYQRQHKLGGYSTGGPTPNDSSTVISPLLFALTGTGIAGAGVVVMVARRRRV